MKKRQLALFPDLEVRLRLRFRILRNIVIDPDTGCWRWQGKKTNASRGRSGQQYPLMSMRVKGYKTPRNLIATRVSLEVFVGPPKPGDEAAHDPACPWADCVNFRHLRWASREENEQDKRHPSRLRLREVHPPVHRIFEDDAPVECPF